jgi:hypothetical protein
MPSVTITVCAGSGWSSAYSFGWNEKKRNLEVERTLEDMEYADDVCLVSHRYKHMQRKLVDLWEESKKVGLEINPPKTKEICVNTKVHQALRLNEEDIKRSSDFCFLGSVVAEDGGASTNVNVRIQKARGSFSKLRKVRLSTEIQKGTKIRIFSACVKSVLLCGCETACCKGNWAENKTFVNRCLRYKYYL